MKTCTTYFYNEAGDCTGMCGAPAIVIYSRPNEETGPTQPKKITHYRCRTHDTQGVRKMAQDQGYESEEIKHE